LVLCCWLLTGFLPIQMASAPYGGGTGTFGDENIRGSTATLNQNHCTAAKFTLSESGDVTKIAAYGNGSGSPADSKALIYSHSTGANAPDALLGTSAVTSVTTTPGWWEYTFSSPVALSAGTYWIAVVTNGNLVFYYTTGVSGARLMHDATIGYASPLSTWSGGSALADYTMSIYATYDK
jgi:hypothetical protein